MCGGGGSQGPSRDDQRKAEREREAQEKEFREQQEAQQAQQQEQYEAEQIRIIEQQEEARIVNEMFQQQQLEAQSAAQAQQQQQFQQQQAQQAEYIQQQQAAAAETARLASIPITPPPSVQPEQPLKAPDAPGDQGLPSPMPNTMVDEEFDTSLPAPQIINKGRPASVKARTSARSRAQSSGKSDTTINRSSSIGSAKSKKAKTGLNIPT